MSLAMKEVESMDELRALSRKFINMEEFEKTSAHNCEGIRNDKSENQKARPLTNVTRK